MSRGVLGTESDKALCPPPGGRSRAREEKAAKYSAEGPLVVLARAERAELSSTVPSSPPERPITAGSRLRVWRSPRLDKLLEQSGGLPAAAGEEEHEKTLLSRLCADILRAEAQEPLALSFLRAAAAVFYSASLERWRWPEDAARVLLQPPREPAPRSTPRRHSAPLLGSGNGCTSARSLAAGLHSRGTCGSALVHGLGGPTRAFRHPRLLLLSLIP